MLNTKLSLTKKHYTPLVNKQKIKFIKQAGIIVSLFCMFLLYSCNSNEKVIAKVGESELTESDAITLLQNKGYKITDTTQLKKVVLNWCENEAFVASLKKKYPEEWLSIEIRSKELSQELSRFYIEKQEFIQLLDTIVTEDEILSYYQEHQNEFVLQDYLVKAFYLKIPKELDFKSENVHQLFLLKNDKDLAEVNSYAKLYAENYYFNDSTWVYFREIAKDIPVSKINVDNIVLNRSKTYLSDDNFTYFINIIDFKLKTEAPPVSFLRSEIKRTIISHRLQKVRSEKEVDLIQRIKKENEIIINL